MNLHSQLFIEHFNIENPHFRLIHDYEERQAETKESWDDVVKFNGWGFGVFLLPQQLVDSKQRWDRYNIQNMHCLYIDVDDGKSIPEKWKADLEPTMICKRKNANKWHAYWKINPTNNIDQWIRLEQALVSYYGGDKGVKNPERIMRIPGTTHWKNPKAPDVYEIIDIIDDWSYDIEDFTDAFKEELHEIDQEKKNREDRLKAFVGSSDNTGLPLYMRNCWLEIMSKTYTERHKIITAWTIDATIAGIPSREIIEKGVQWLEKNGRNPAHAQGEMIRLVDFAQTATTPSFFLSRIPFDLIKGEEKDGN